MGQPQSFSGGARGFVDSVLACGELVCGQAFGVAQIAARIILPRGGHGDCGRGQCDEQGEDYDFGLAGSESSRVSDQAAFLIRG
jgi:hypothetical protein